MINLIKGTIYIGKIANIPVKYVGVRVHEDSLKILHQFEYVLPEHRPNKHKAGIIGYGQSDEQVNKECYTVVEVLDIIYGIYGQ